MKRYSTVLLSIKKFKLIFTVDYNYFYGVIKYWKILWCHYVQNNFWLVEEGKLEKKDTQFESKVLHSFKTAKWNQKKIIVVLKFIKRFLFEKIDKICKYLSLSHKPDYQRSGLNTYHFVSLFQWFK